VRDITDVRAQFVERLQQLLVARASARGPRGKSETETPDAESSKPSAGKTSSSLRWIDRGVPQLQKL
jgi:hypothetical protein